MIKAEKKYQKLYLIDYNLLIAQDLRQANYQILLIILQKEFIELNVNMDMTKKCETWWIKYKNCEYFLECTDLKDNLTKCRCLFCNKNYSKKFDETLKKRFFNTYKFSNYDINKFILFLQKGF